MDRFEHGMLVHDHGAGGRGTLLWIHGLGESGPCFELLGEAGVPVTQVGPSGHWPFVDQPDEFANELVRKLKEEEHP